MSESQQMGSQVATLYPRSNALRQRVDLSGFWGFRFDPEDAGLDAGWGAGFAPRRPIAAPASWNEQFEEMRDYLGSAWYRTSFALPWGWSEKRVRLRFGSVNYLAEVWLNGAYLGVHEGGHLPFEFDATPHLRGEENLLVVRVEGELAPDRVPPGRIPPDPRDDFPHRNHPDTSFDFFPFCGIHRPVMLYATPHDAITDLTVRTELEGTTGLVRVRLDRTPGDEAVARLTLKGHGAEVAEEVRVPGGTSEVELTLPDAALWSPGSPNLYELTAELSRGGEVFDRYSLPVGVRTVVVEGDALLLNGEPVKLRGFGRHEDFPIAGRGLVPPAVVKDYSLMCWVGANSFRTSHYPYSEETMDLADRLGFLVVDETPAVGLFFAEQGLERRLELCRRYVRELVARDKNRPGVILWSLANEPHSKRPGAKGFFRELYDLAKSLDPTRPATLASMHQEADEAFEFCDVVCLNRYFGWYTEPGMVEDGLTRLSEDLDAVHAKYPKPVIVTEFGADALPGCHSYPHEMFSEEYQAEMISGYARVLDAKPYVVGQHVWNMCDFKTGQEARRVGGMNLKGVFTRDRRPKLAAHRLKALWGDRHDAHARKERA